ncbi:MAG: hypothetical protein JRN20_23160 [Nitrososphaerota archaeon]|nr:hypothetical protein [Nitrososphaerota archaeon]
MNGTQKLSIIALFTSLAIVTDYAMLPIPNVKLVFTLTFSSSYAFGFKIGAAVAILTELIWGTISPDGFGGLIIPFLVAANIIYAFAGWGASKIWGHDLRPISSLNIFFGSILAVCAFLWDTATNFGTGILIVWPHVTVAALLYYEGFGIPFMVFHELGDFVLGSAVAPVIIVYFLRVFGGQRDRLSMKAKGDITTSGTKSPTTQI